MKRLFLFPLLALGLTTCGPSNTGPAAAGDGKFIILDTLTDKGDREKSKKNAEVTLLKHPDIAAMIGLYAFNAPACLEALKDAGQVGKVKLFSFDEDQVTLQGIKDGSIEGTVVQNPYEFGYQSIKYLNMIADGAEIKVPANGEIPIEARTIVKDNVETFSKELAERRAKGEAASKAPKPVSQKRFAFIINMVDPFWTYAEAGCFQAQQEFNVIADFLAPQTASVEEQNRIIETVLQQDYDGVAISPLDPANQTQILNTIAEKLPLLCHDSDAPNSKRRFYLGTDNYTAGRMLGKLVKERMPQGGKVMLFVGNVDMLNAQQRRQGVIDELNGTPAPTAPTEAAPQAATPAPVPIPTAKPVP